MPPTVSLLFVAFNEYSHQHETICQNFESWALGGGRARLGLKCRWILLCRLLAMGEYVDPRDDFLYLGHWR